MDSLDALLADCTPWQREIAERMLAGEPIGSLSLANGRAAVSGKRHAMRLAITVAVSRGESVHVLTPAGTTCAGVHAGCTLPRWDGMT